MNSAPVLFSVTVANSKKWCSSEHRGCKQQKQTPETVMRYPRAVTAS